MGKFQMGYRRTLLAVAVIALLLASFIEYQSGVAPADSWLFGSKTYIGLFKEFGFAFFIAWIVLVTIEKHNKRRQIESLEKEREQIKRDVFEAIFGIALPENVRKAVENKILDKKFYRTGSTSSYEIIPKNFERVDGSFVKGVLLKAHCSFKISNMSGDPEEYPFEVIVEKPQLKNLKDPLRNVSIDSVCLDGKHLSREEIDKADIDAPDDAAKRLIREITVQPNKTVNVDFSFSAVRGFDDSELWVTIVPNDGMKLEVNFPPGVESFGLFPLHSSEPIQTHASKETGYYAWELRDTVLPNQGMMLWWRLTDSIISGFPTANEDESEPAQRPDDELSGNLGGVAKRARDS